MSAENLNTGSKPLKGNECVNCDRCSCNSCATDTRCNLHAYNWLADVPGGTNDFELVEVHFKNTRKGFYRNTSHLDLKEGDLVAVEANPGHDIGRVSMTGSLVKLQMKKANLKPDIEILRVFRKAKPADLERFEQAKAREVDTMIRSRQIAADLNLKMKIGDVEYQGDGNKAIFYYIADERVDFRQLIKVLAEVFKIRVEMKQIGARQEAGRIGGIGPCGRPLCCASWMTNFVSVATSAARYQDICINFEVDSYVEITKQLPPREVPLETKDNVYFHFKTDMFKKEITYSTDKNMAANLVTITAERAFEVMALNKNGVRPDKLNPDNELHQAEIKAFGDIIGQDSISRFDKKKKKKSKNRNRPAGENRGPKEAKGGVENGRPKPNGNPRKNGGNPRRRPQIGGGDNGGNHGQNRNGNGPMVFRHKNDSNPS